MGKVRQQWTKTLGRVVFLNCDPIFEGLDESWNILPAPPAWLTGHLLRGDCLVASIPSADYAKHYDDLILLPNIGISSRGEVGSVLLFGTRPIAEMRDIALPSDSATSRRLLMYLLGLHGISPRAVEMGPDLSKMLERADGALLIGDRALDEAIRNPHLVQMDLGQEWFDQSGLPMVFGVFAARRDSPAEYLAEALQDLLNAQNKFSDVKHREYVVARSAERSKFSAIRIEKYFSKVSNNMFDEEVAGLKRFLSEVCGVEDEPTFFEP